MPFANTDLLIPDSELAQITAALANTGEADPIGRVIAECDQVVTDYTARYSITETRRNRLIRGIAPAELYRMAGGTVPEHHQRTHDSTMKELTDIRDGKFPDLAPAVTAPAGAGGGAWGSASKIEPRAAS